MATQTNYKCNKIMQIKTIFLIFFSESTLIRICLLHVCTLNEIRWTNKDLVLFSEFQSLVLHFIRGSRKMNRITIIISFIWQIIYFLESDLQLNIHKPHKAPKCHHLSLFIENSFFEYQVHCRYRQICNKWWVCKN